MRRTAFLILLFVLCSASTALAVFNPDIPPVCGWDYDCLIDTSSEVDLPFSKCTGAKCRACAVIINPTGTTSQQCVNVHSNGLCKCDNKKVIGTGCENEYGVCTYTPN